jgi:hypothetical protein
MLEALERAMGRKPDTDTVQRLQEGGLAIMFAWHAAAKR